MLFHAGQRAAGGELQVGVGRGELHARTRLPGLDDHGAALGGRQRRQRSAHVVIAAAEVQHVHLLRIGKHAALAIEHDRVGLDAVPQRPHDLEMLLRALIAGIVLDQLVVTPVRRLVLRARGDRIPGNAPAGDVIERVEQARDVEGMMIRGGHGDAETNSLCRPRHARNHRHHVVPWPLHPVAHGGVVIAPVFLGRAGGVAEEQQIEDAAGRDACDVLVEVGAAVIGVAGPGARHSPEIVGVKEREIGGEVDDLGSAHAHSTATLGRSSLA